MESKIKIYVRPRNPNGKTETLHAELKRVPCVGEWVDIAPESNGHKIVEVGWFMSGDFDAWVAVQEQ